MKNLSNNEIIHIKSKGLEYLQFKRLNTYNLKHCITTRLGGVSKGQLSSLNLSFNVGDERENVLRNYQIICEELGLNHKDLVLSKQVHGSNIRIVDKSNCGEGIIKDIQVHENDAVITNVEGIPLITFYADCVPILFFEPQKKVIAMAHSGWKGTIAEICKNTIDKMIDNYNIDTRNLICAIGPSIGCCCFDVKDDVASIFLEKYRNIDNMVYKNGNKLYNINLTQIIKKQLLESHVLLENILMSNICTSCNHEIMYSYRKSKGTTGRFGVIMSL